jgi:uncharacterized membrane protein YdbT with pleckstrin-like domain
MGVTRDLREGEYVVVSVTPVAERVMVPLVATVAAIAAVLAAASTWQWAKDQALWLALFLVLPCAIVLGGRVWRWRSRKIVVTNQRVLVSSGVSQRRRRAVELMDVTSSTLDQRWYERLTRRGYVVLETLSGEFTLDRVRRPDALWRVIDHQHHQLDRRDRARLDRADELSRDRELGKLSDEEYDERWRHLFGPGGSRG